MLEETSFPVRRLALLSGLSDDEIRVVSGFLQRRPMAAGEVLFTEGDEVESLYIPVRGRLEVLTAPPRRTLATIEPGEMFGLSTLLTDGPQSVSCRAATDSIVLELRREDFDQLAEAPGTLGIRVVHQVLKHLARQLRAIDEVLDDWGALPPPVPSTVHHGPRPAPAAPPPAEPEPEPEAAPRKKRGRRANSDTDEQLLDKIREYSQKAGLGDLDRIRVARSGDQKIKPPGYDAIRRR